MSNHKQRHFRTRYRSSGNWTPWRTFQNNFQYIVSDYDRIEFRDAPDPCDAVCPVTIEGHEYTCEKDDINHTGKHEIEHETHDSYGSSYYVTLAWERD